MQNINQSRLHRGHAKRVLDWCIERYGKSKYSKHYPTIRFIKFTDYENIGLLGYYEPEFCEIFINSEDHLNVDELCKTIIEEYQHYMQSDSQYQKMAKVYSYDQHPLEKQAQKIANTHYKICVKELKKYHKTFFF
jgi:hypothetical protein